MLALGVDVVQASRVARLARLYGARFLRRIYADDEIGEYKRRIALGNKEIGERRALEFLASRWAIKEATYKAFYPDTILGWKDITVASTQHNKKPALNKEGRLGEALQGLGARAALVSVSHDGDYAFATVAIV